MKLQNKESIKITDDNIPNFIPPPPSSSALECGTFYLCLEVKDSVLFQTEGRDTSHHSPILKPNIIIWNISWSPGEMVCF